MSTKNARLRSDDEDMVPARRLVMKVLGGTFMLIGCANGTDFTDAIDGPAGDSNGGGGGTAAVDAATTPASCAVSPDETLGPYPDKTGMLTNAAYNRSDITEGKDGLTLKVVLTVVNTNSACAAVANAAVIIWQCDAEGHYSEYTGQPGGYDGTGATFLRGVQTADANGQVIFKTVYPGWYAGRATHIHAQVFVDGISKKVTQLAFPETITSAVYTIGVYAAKGANPQPNATDMVFEDSLQSELANLTGDTTSGYTATLTIGVPL